MSILDEIPSPFTDEPEPLEDDQSEDYCSDCGEEECICDENEDEGDDEDDED